MNDDDVQRLLATLSPKLKSVWAKTGIVDGDPYAMWLPLVGHAMDAAGVAGFLWDKLLSASQKSVIAQCFSDTPPPSASTSQQEVEERRAAPRLAEAEARAFVELAAAVHDVGKISKPFARQAPRLADEMMEQGLQVKRRESQEAQENRWMRHELAGAVAIEKAGQKLGWDRPTVAALASVTGGHHGIPSQSEQLRIARRERLHFLVDGGPDDPWSDTQAEFLEFAKALTGGPTDASPKLTTAALVLIQGLVMVADWISSSTEYFPLTNRDDRTLRYLERQGGQRKRLERALQLFQMPSVWNPKDSGADASTLLRDRLDLPFPARPLQDAAVSAARTLPSPGMIIIEDAMGSGKTEAAFLASQILAARFGANGLLIALPTQATTDAMFQRMLDFLNAGLEEEDKDFVSRLVDSPAPPSVALLHGRADWNPQATALARSGRAFLDNAAGVFSVDLGDGQVETEELQRARPKFLTHPWLRGRNKAILSSLVTTTVDHLLMGALQMKHLALRHLGLSSKIVVFDEVHASSRFMNFFATRVLEWLGSYRVPVVMLSATLDSDLRGRLISSYQKGLRSGGTDKKRQDPTPLQTSDTGENGAGGPYPRLTWVNETSVEQVEVAPATPPREVRISAQSLEETPSSIAKQLATNRRGNILVLVNTVSRAQQTYAELEEEFGGKVRLVHARFTAADRMENDEWLLNTYGPDADDRPEFSIVVATQVVEQSLDVDFDVLVTDVAPVDLLLQRIGRVHRHDGVSRPLHFHRSECQLVGAPSMAEVPDLAQPTLRSACTIYGQMPVLSSILTLGPELFDPEGCSVTLPQEIGALVERAAQGDFVTPEPWLQQMEIAAAKWQEEEDIAEQKIAEIRLSRPSRRRGRYATLNDWYGTTTEAGEGPARVARGKVRDGLEGLDVILVNEKDGNVYTMPTADAPEGVRLALDVPPDEWTARQALLGTVALPAWAVTEQEEVIGDLEQRCWGPGLEDSYLLGGELLLPLVEGETELGGYRYRYTRARGLEVQSDN